MGKTPETAEEWWQEAARLAAKARKLQDATDEVWRRHAYAANKASELEGKLPPRWPNDPIATHEALHDLMQWRGLPYYPDNPEG
jgi:hypothetical protein